MSVLLVTSFGDIVIDLYPKKAPNACLNFLKLCKIKHYNNALVSEVQKNYVTKIKPNPPTTIWKQIGQNMPYFKDQIDVEMKINELGLVATANTGSNLNNSQFFITLTKANLSSLSGKHTVFGKVQEGYQVLKKINDTYVDSKNRPQMNIRILHTYVLDDPYEDWKSIKFPSRSPSPVKESDRLEAVQHLQMLEKCQSEKEILEATRQQKAKKQAMTLEILGDLPDSNLRPPQNILFICKLNPITQERDLEVIFSRFGPIKSVQIVRDWKTGQSLQYGFVDFQNISSCEEAYLKMNNVIIDDRRIQVDFSQSVSKLLHRNRGGILHSKPKFGDQQEKKRQLLPKSYTQGKNTQPNYELLINQPKPKYHQKRQIEPRQHHRNKSYSNDTYKHRKQKDKHSRDRSRSHHKKQKSQKIKKRYKRSYS